MARRRSASIRVAKGVRIRVGSKSSSISVGGKYGRVTLNSKGRRTTTMRPAPGVSLTTTSGGRASKAAPRPAAKQPKERFEPPRVKGQVGPMRRLRDGGWIVASRDAIVVRRPGHDDDRISMRLVSSIELDKKVVVVEVAGHGRRQFTLFTLLSSWDMRFVNAVAEAAGLRRTG